MSSLRQICKSCSSLTIFILTSGHCQTSLTCLDLGVLWSWHGPLAAGQPCPGKMVTILVSYDRSHDHNTRLWLVKWSQYLSLIGHNTCLWLVTILVSDWSQYSPLIGHNTLVWLVQVLDESELAQQRLMLSILAACAGPDCQIYDGEEQEGEWYSDIHAASDFWGINCHVNLYCIFSKLNLYMNTTELDEWNRIWTLKCANKYICFKSPSPLAHRLHKPGPGQA